MPQTTPKTWSVDTKLIGGFVCISLLLACVLALTFRNSQQLKNTAAEVARSHIFIEDLEKTLQIVVDFETGQRGFAITGQDVFLEPFYSAQGRINQQLDKLVKSTASNPVEHQLVRNLAAEIGALNGWHRSVIQIAAKEGLPEAQRMVASGEGRKRMDAIRLAFGQLRRAEEERLKLRYAESESFDRRSRYATALLALITLSILLAAFLLVRRYMKDRRVAEEQRDRFFMHSLDMLFIATVDGRFKRLNPAFSTTLGWSAEELARRPFLELVHPEDRASTARLLDQLKQGQPNTGSDIRLLCKDGSSKLILWKAVPEPDGTFFATAHDVTLLRSSQEALRRSEEDLAVTLESIGDAVLATDALRRVSRLNRVAEKLTGWTQAEALGRPVEEIFNIVNEHTRKKAIIPVDEVLATGQIQGLANHTVLIARDGTERPIADSAAPIRDRNGSIVGVVLVFRDVTEEHKSEQLIRESERRLRALNENLERRVEERSADVLTSKNNLQTIFNNVNVAIFIHSPDGGIIAVNDKVLELYDVGSEEALSFSIEKEYSSRSNPLNELPAIWQQVLQGKPYVTEWIARRPKDGGTFPVEVYLRKIRWDDKDAVMAAVHDLTEKRALEKRFLRSQRLESIGTLAGGVAHDLNNALAPILMGAELLRADYPDSSGLIDTFENGAVRAAAMVRQLLTFARGAEGARVAIQPKHLLKEMQGIIASTFPKDIRLVLKSPPELPTVIGDATQLHQVLLNLCVNARDAMPNGGTLTMEALVKEVDLSFASAIPDAKPGNYLAMTVKDTGVGIPTEIIDRIFDPFFTTKGPDKGTGLGLSTVMGIVKGHGGFLHVYSQRGLGSTFTAYLPVSDTDEAEASPRKNLPGFRGGGETILVVDDEVAVREVARAVLGRLNFESLIASDGAEALMLLAQHREELRLIITDLHMPHMDGLTFVRAVRRVLPKIPIIIASGRMDESASEEFKNLSVTATLSKPFTERQLVEVLRKIFSQPS